jgi:hypothetical protein
MGLYDRRRQLPGLLSSRERLPIHAHPVLIGLYDCQLPCLLSSRERLPIHAHPVLIGLYDRQLPGFLSSRERLSIHTLTCPNGIV